MRYPCLKTFTVVLLFVLSQSVTAQKFDLGGEAIYNLQTNGFGLGIRTELPVEQLNLLYGVTIAPQISYFPGFNKVHEFSVGSSIHIGLYPLRKSVIYGLANISYNGWINHESSASSKAKFSNLGFELGGGITGKKCLRPFFEYRYNIKWKEANIRLGVIYTINCNKKGQVPCPKIPQTPVIKTE